MEKFENQIAQLSAKSYKLGQIQMLLVLQRSLGKLLNDIDTQIDVLNAGDDNE